MTPLLVAARLDALMPSPPPPSTEPARTASRRWRPLAVATSYLLLALLANAATVYHNHILLNRSVIWLMLGWPLFSSAGLYLAMRCCAGLSILPRAQQNPAPPASFTELAQRLPDAVVLLARERIAWVNPAAEQLVGDGQRSLIGQTLHDRLLPPPVRPIGAKAPGVWRLRRDDGSLLPIDVLVDAPLGSDQRRLLLLRELDDTAQMRSALAERNAELHAMTQRLFSLQEDERRAISRDLHDEIGQTITAIKLSAHAALDECDATRRREDLQGVLQLADASLTRLRNLSTLLRPPQLDALGLEAALRWQAATLSRAASAQLQLDIATLPQRPGREVEQACFRIAQESLTNALRHASANQIVLSLHARDAQLALEVSDDGEGFDPHGPRGLGLIIMRERAQGAGGSLRIDSAPGAGTRISLRLPYPSVVATATEATMP